MTLTQIRQFQAVCRYQNVTKAAEAMHMAQPSVSSSVRELESELGVNLFHRMNRRLTLTQEGEFFLERVGPIIDQLDKLQEQMMDMGSRKNLIHIGVPPMIGTFLFPDMFDAFKRLYPEINLEIEEHGSLGTRELVRGEELDIAIAISGEKKDPEISELPILATRLLFCVGAGHPLAGRESVGLAELAGEPIILFKEDSSQHVIVTERFRRLGIAPNILLSSSQLYTIKKFIASGRAGAFLFSEIAEMEPDLVGIPLEDPIEMEISLIWKKNRLVKSGAAKFIGFTKQYGRGQERNRGVRR